MFSGLRLESKLQQVAKGFKVTSILFRSLAPSLIFSLFLILLLLLLLSFIIILSLQIYLVTTIVIYFYSVTQTSQLQITFVIVRFVLVV